MTPPNTESDKSIDEILRRAPNEDGYIEDEDMKIAKSQLLAEILKGKETYEKAYGTSQSNLRGLNIEAVPITYLTELFYKGKI